MKTRHSLLSMVVLLGAALALGAKKPEVPKNKMPDLKVDATAVTEGGKPGLVASYADMLEAVRPAVVSVYSKTNVSQPTMSRLGPFLVPGPERQTPVRGTGSGVIISPDGYILTNNHVVADADELEVQLSDGKKLEAKPIGKDPKTDIAVIKVDGDKLPAATLGDSSKLRVGDVVFAIGNPLDVGQTITMGIVSATKRQVGILDEVGGYEDFIQTDAAINQGNSGGALVDAKGRVVGINSAILSNTQGNIGIGFAIPIKLASSIMRSLIERGSVTRGYLGVQTDALTPEIAEGFGLKPDTKGVVIKELSPADGPAAKAGLKLGDVIVALDDKPVTSFEELRLQIAETPPGTKIAVKILRKGEPKTVDVTLAQRTDDTGSDGDLIAGVSVTPLTPELRREQRIANSIEGLLVTDVDARSPFRDSIPEGSVIVQINGEPVTDLASARRAMREDRNMALIWFRGVRRFVRIDPR